MLDHNDELVIKEAREGGAVLVTWDRVLRQAAGGITPYEALDQAKIDGKGTPEAQAEVSRLRTLAPRDLTILRDAGNETYLYFRKTIEVSRKSAKLIRHLRVEKSFSWRSIARYWSLIHGGAWGANQLAGIAICEKASRLLHEDFLQPPWN